MKAPRPGFWVSDSARSMGAWLAFSGLLAGSMLSCGSPAPMRPVDAGAETAAAGAQPETADGGFDAGPGPADGVDAGVGDAGEAGGMDAGAGVRACGGTFDGEVTLVHQGRSRRALVYVPASAAGHAAPLILSLHGFSSDPEEHRDTTHYRELAEAKGFIVAFPSGVARSWNGGACCGPSNVTGVDDVGFLRALISFLSVEYCVDARRIHVSGFSNGGFLAHRMGCEAADVVASVGVVAGQMAVAACAPVRPMPVAQLHGALDPVVPFPGNPFLGFPATMTTAGGWAERDGCQATTRDDDAGVQLHRWTQCAGGAQVQLTVVEGGGHDWFGGGSKWDGGGPVNATLTLLDFFDAHPMR
ncbi:MAG: PHB depolymerase family esterase [Myxococcota bacterium]